MSEVYTSKIYQQLAWPFLGNDFFLGFLLLVFIYYLKIQLFLETEILMK